MEVEYIYTIHNNAQIKLQKLNGTDYQEGYISKAIEILTPKNKTSINAVFLDNKTFYDSNDKVFYDISYDPIKNTDMIVDITNDGNTAVLQDGRIVAITRSYKQVL